MRNSRKVALSSVAGFEGGMHVQIGDDAEAEVAQLVRVSRKRSTVTLGQWRWYHSVLRSARRFARHPVLWSAYAWCALRGHPLGSPDEDGCACCRCGERLTGDGW